MRTLSLVLVLAIVMVAAALIASPAFILGGGPGGPGGPGFAGGPPPPPGKGPRDRDDEESGSHGGTRVPPMMRDITDEDIAQIMAFVSENMPWMKAELDKMKESGAAKYRPVWRSLRFEINQLQRLKAADPEAFKNSIAERQLRYNAVELAAKVQAATDPKQRDALKADLRNLLDKLFDVEIAARTAQIHQIEVRLDALRKDLKDRVAVRKDVVDKRLEEMLKGGKPEGPPTPLPPAAPPKNEPTP